MDNTTSVRDKFWIDDISILYKDENYLEFVPYSGMTRIEKLNALIRFFMYYIILIFLFQFDKHFLYIPVVGIIFITALYYIFRYDPKGGEKELHKEKGINIEKFNQEDNGNAIEYNLESGFYDSNGNLNIGPEYTAKTRAGNNIQYTTNELLEYQKNSCRKPTKDNPFMNPPMTDFNDGFKPSACNADDEDIQDQIKDTYNIDLYRNVQDLFNVKNSQRQFYTIPTTQIPNDQSAFANWLYKSPTTCKEDSVNCLRFELLKYKR
jgi:hypothetical protein